MPLPGTRFDLSLKRTYLVGYCTYLVLVSRLDDSIEGENEDGSVGHCLVKSDTYTWYIFGIRTISSRSCSGTEAA